MISECVEVEAGRTRAGKHGHLPGIATAESRPVRCDNDPTQPGVQTFGSAAPRLLRGHEDAVAYMSIDGGRPTPLCERCLTASIEDSSQWPMESYVVVEIKVSP